MYCGGGAAEIARWTERHLPRQTDSNRRLLTVRASRSFPRCISLRSLLTYVSQPTLLSCTLRVWIIASAQSLPFLFWLPSMSCRSPPRHSLPCAQIQAAASLYIYLSIPKAPLSQGFSSCMALHTTASLLLGYIPDVNIAVSVQDHAVHGRL